MRALFHRHSTLFGLAATALVAVAAGLLTHWSPVITAAAGIGSLFIFPRLFYGIAESRLLKNEPAAADSAVGLYSRDLAGIGAKPAELERAYRQVQFAANGGFDETGKPADAAALEKFAQRERD